MPLSGDPDARRAQLANLRQGPPAPIGNRHRVTHGGYARVARDRAEAKVREVFDALARDAPLRDPDGGLPAADAVPVRLLAECLCRLDDVAANVRDYGLFDQATGEPRPVLELERRLRLEAAGHADTLGLNPRARAALGLDLSRTAGAVDASTALSLAREESDPEVRRELLRRAGIGGGARG